MGFIDLHVHSTYSDGTYTPAQLVDYAVEKGLTAMALTDHDTVDGLDEITKYAGDKPVEIIPGIEFSTEYNGRDVHIVGLFIDYKAPVFLEYLARFQQSRTDRNHKLCANLQKAGIEITYDALIEAFPDAVITRAHYACFMMDKGYVKSRNEAFDRYLGDHTPYFVHREKITPQEVIEVTLRAGGIPVLAHPTLYGFGREQLDVLVSTLKNAGLMGIESVYSTYTAEQQGRIKSLAKKYRLLESGGSDFHGANKPGVDLATGYGKLYVHEDILTKMKKSLDTKILFSDLDETLLTSDKKVTEKTRAKIREMLEKGNHFVLASGRPLNSLLAVYGQMGFQEAELKKFSGGIYATAYNGAVLYDCVKKNFIDTYGIPVAVAQAVFDMAVSRGIHIQTYSDTHIISCAEDAELAFYKRAVQMEHLVETRLDRVLSHDPYKVIAIVLQDRARLEAFKEEIESSEIGQEVTCAFSNAQYLEFYDKKAGKGNALINLCNALNVHVKNSVAAGDEENDVSMLEAAAVGVCMANGSPAAKACADHITEHDNDHDGVAEIIERFITGKE